MMPSSPDFGGLYLHFLPGLWLLMARGFTQGHVAYGVKIEDRIKVRRGLKLRNAAGTMLVDTRMGREHAIGANGELSCARLPAIRFSSQCTALQCD